MRTPKNPHEMGLDELIEIFWVVQKLTSRRDRRKQMVQMGAEDTYIVRKEDELIAQALEELDRLVPANRQDHHS